MIKKAILHYSAFLSTDSLITVLGNIIENSIEAFGGASVKRIHRPVNAEGKVVSVAAYTVPLLEKASQERDNITLLTDTTATQILTDEAGAACGIAATGKSGTTVTVNAVADFVVFGCMAGQQAAEYVK